ncbi:hypothetical protein ABG768_026994, partial [Culter alburnus]
MEPERDGACLNIHALGPQHHPNPPKNPQRSTPVTCSRLRPTPKETQAGEKKEL